MFERSLVRISFTDSKVRTTLYRVTKLPQFRKVLLLGVSKVPATLLTIDHIIPRLEVIIDYGSAFVTYGKITETKWSRKESSFPAEVPLIKFTGAANLQSTVIARKFLS